RLTQIPELALQNLSASLPPSLRSLIRPALEAQAGILGATIEVLRQSTQQPSALYLYGNGDRSFEAIDGEIFTNGSSLFVVEIAPVDNERRRLDALWEAERSGDTGRRPALSPPEWRLSFYYVGSCLNDPDLNHVKEAIDKAFSVTLQAERFGSRRFKELR